MMPGAPRPEIGTWETKNLYRLISHPLQKLNFAQQLRRLVFKLRALDNKIFFRILARLELEVQVAQIFVELLLALQQIVQPRLLALRGEDVLRPEGVDEEHKQQQHSANQSQCRRHKAKPSIALIPSPLVSIPLVPIPSPG